MADLTGARWHTSTRSSSDGGTCVKVADESPGVVLVRNTKGRDGGTLTFTPAARHAFVATVAGQA